MFVFHFWCYFFLKIQASTQYFSSTWWTSFSTSCSLDLLISIPSAFVSFCFNPKTSLFGLHSWKILLLFIEFLIDSFFFQHFKDIIPMSSPFYPFCWETHVIWITVLLSKVGAFRIFSDSQKWLMIYQGMAFFLFILLGGSLRFWNFFKCMSFTRFGNVLAIFSLNIFPTLFFHFPFFLDSNYMHVKSFEKILFFSPIFFSLKIRYFPLTYPQVYSLSIVILLSSSSECLILNIVLFSFRIFTVFFLKFLVLCWIIFYTLYYFMYIWNIPDNIFLYTWYICILFCLMFSFIVSYKSLSANSNSGFISAGISRLFFSLKIESYFSSSLYVK